MTFRDRLVATIRAARPILETDGVLVVGSEVPNLLEPGFAATLVVSQGLDVGIPVARHAKERLEELERAYRRLRPELRPRRAELAALLRRLESGDPELP